MNNNLTLGVKDFFVSEDYLYFRYGVPGLREVIIDLNTMANLSFQRYVTSNFLYSGTICAVFQNQFVKVNSAEEIVSLVKNYYDTKDSLKVREEYSTFYTLAKDIDPGSNGILTFLAPDF
jgi:methionine salvage enolase-phosphatase E1